ncbi:MAG: hypothetical protein GQ532_16710 [Methylomarinum sp.]|nr:hypothetical protein [Methylomarinum sp.]
MSWFEKLLIISTCTLLFSYELNASQRSEYILDEQLVLESASEIKGSLEKIFERFKRKRSFFPKIKSKLENQAAFWRDTDLSAQFRSYYLNRDKNQFNDSEA